jgi:hypothetical protein
MRRVIIESPLAGANPEEVAANVAYAKLCMRDSLARGEAPFASHLLYAQDGILDDTVACERETGIEAGLAWGAVADAVAVYMDRGVSPGMHRGIARHRLNRLPIEKRRLGNGRARCGVTGLY